MSRSVSLSDLTLAQANALEWIRSSRLYRVRDGWQGPGTPRVSRRTADVLIGLELVHVDHSGAHPRLALTEEGKELAK